jgi:hypothetical protein
MRVNSKASGEVHILVDVLQNLEKGTVITYGVLSGKLGRDVCENRAPLHTAFKHLKKHHGMVFDVVRGIGYKRVVDNELVGLADKHVRGIRKKAARACDEMRTADLTKLDQSERIALAARSGLCAAIEGQTTHKAIQRAEEAVANNHAISAMKETLQALKEP